MIRMEPASLGGLTAIPGSTWVGGEITPLELSSFRLRLSEPFGDGSLLGGAVSRSAASRGIVATANRPQTIATVSVRRRKREERALRDRPIDMASLIDSFVTLATQRGLRVQRSIQKLVMTPGQSSACGRWSRCRYMIYIRGYARRRKVPYRVARTKVRALELDNAPSA
jgi:hypothetical protein